MKASELRIGNLIYVDGKLRYVFGTIYKTIQHNYHSKNSTYSENYENECEPIPLTEEWLLKFGFEKDKKNKSFNLYKHNCYDLFFRIFDGGAISFCFSNEYILIKSVHQLQNLYFALTNEELIIK